MKQAKILQGLFLSTIILTSSVSAQIPLSSRTYNKGEEGTIRYMTNNLFSKQNISAEKETLKGDCKEDDKACKEYVDNIEDKIPEGFGSFAFGSFNGGVEAQVNILRYNLHYSGSGHVPFYLFATTKSEGEDNQVDEASSKLLGANSGLLNIKFADDIFSYNGKGEDGKGVCNFKSGVVTTGGCYLNFQLGAKLLEYKDEQDDTKQMAAAYVSLQASLDWPILNASTNEKAGRLVFSGGVSGYYANTDKIEHLFPEFKDSDVGKLANLKKAYASLDAGLLFTITDQFSISATVSKPLVNDEHFETVSKINFTYQPK